MTDATLQQALSYARRGWPVFPCLPGQKIPATTHGYQDATTDDIREETIGSGWSAATPAPSARRCATRSPTCTTRGGTSAPPNVPAPNAPPPPAPAAAPPPGTGAPPPP